MDLPVPIVAFLTHSIPEGHLNVFAANLNIHGVVHADSGNVELTKTECLSPGNFTE